MDKYKVVLFDADGVIIMPQKPFSAQFAVKYGLNPEGFQQFFKGDFTKAIVGEADLKDIILEHNDIWNWDGDINELLNMWFEAENYVDQELLDIINNLRKNGLPVYLATNQEKHRAKYLRETMFPDVFNGFFISSEIGSMKNDTSYWDSVFAELSKSLPDIKPQDILFVDDSEDNIDTAAKIGIGTILYANISQIKDLHI